MKIAVPDINLLEYFEPFFAFRFIVFLIFAAIFFYEIFDLALWYHNLPGLAKKYIKMKVITLKLGTLKSELILTGMLFLFWFFVLWLNLKLM
ncbi:MAG: hypothetical protein HY730_03920 [Candidatus Tectomicrobia bacterium]|uniref:Uncharacterized protein n=1 Tax=Tectimicrobiota bacterium TaxID=2528274 RepID=A0A933GML2_UNCTE|nr:hypothetical protein [Candidatus Tectomicrobia bacterium]